MSTVQVSFAALPAHVRTARLIAIATARRAGVDEDLIDEIRFAVGEACSRAVSINAAEQAPVVMTMTDEQGRFTVEVQDIATQDGSEQLSDFDLGGLGAPEGSATKDSGSLPDALPPGFGLAVIAGLVEQTAVTSDVEGTRVTLTWPAPDVMAPDPV